MAIDAMRYVEKAVTIDGLHSVTFPTDLYEWQDVGPFRAAHTRLFSNNFVFDHLRNAVSPRDLARTSVRFGIGEASAILNDAKVEEIITALAGRGPIWLYTLGVDGTRRKARCRLHHMPDIVVSYKNGRNALASLDFERYTDWLAEDPVMETIAVTASPQSFTIENPGSMPADEVVVRFRANSGTGFTNPKLENQTNGYSFESTRDATDAAHELRLDTSEPSVKWSTNDGGNYSDDLVNLVMPTTFMPLAFPLDPGPNSLRYNGGAIDANIEITFYPKYLRG